MHKWPRGQTSTLEWWSFSGGKDYRPRASNLFGALEAASFGNVVRHSRLPQVLKWSRMGSKWHWIWTAFEEIADSVVIRYLTNQVEESRIQGGIATPLLELWIPDLVRSFLLNYNFSWFSVFLIPFLSVCLSISFMSLWGELTFHPHWHASFSFFFLFPIYFSLFFTLTTSLCEGIPSSICSPSALTFSHL